jgi:hypothetical protein
MFFSRQERSARPRRQRRAPLAGERLEPRALMTVSPGAEFARPAWLQAATEPTAYFDVSTGVLQLDPVGRNLSLVNFTYNTQVANITGSSPGPFVFPGGTVQNAVSTPTEKKTFPVGTWSLLTTFPARIAGAMTLGNTPTLATTGANSASTNGWFNKPWSFGAVAAPNSLSIREARQNFIGVNTSTDVGSGPGRDIFQYTEFGVTGLHYGQVVVYGQERTSLLGVAGNDLVVSRSTGTSFTTSPLATLPAGSTWVNTVSGDFNGDGRTDIASQTSAGAWWVTTTPASGTATPQAWGTLATSQFATVGDFNGDKKADIAVRDPSDGSWQVLTSTGSGFTTSRFGRWNPSLSWSNVLAGDFNNDGRDDIVGQRSDGAWVVAASTGTAFSSNVWAWFSTGQFGTVGDFNGDGRDDVAVRNANNGAWRVLTSTGNTFDAVKYGTWDAASTWSRVRAGDFNGDGRTDLVGQRADGAWHVSLSNGASFATSAWASLPINQFVTVGDYNGDGYDDVAVRNPSDGAWRVLSSNGSSSFTSSKFGEWPTSKAWSRAFAARA